MALLSIRKLNSSTVGLTVKMKNSKFSARFSAGTNKIFWLNQNFVIPQLKI
jgi:hypothetical protein